MEVQDSEGKPIPGFTLEECHELYGDDLQRKVAWRHGDDTSKLAGQPVRVRFVLQDADVFSFQFVK